MLAKKAEEMEHIKAELERQVVEKDRRSNELEQEKIILEELSETNEKNVSRARRKYYYAIAMIAAVSAAGFMSYSYYENQVLLGAVHVGNYNSNYVIQNLRGDVVNTYVSWNVAQGTVLTVNVINQAGVSPDNLFAVKNAILSKDPITLENSLLNKIPATSSAVYYKGWEGALAAASSQKTRYFIPQEFKITDDPDGSGDIVITLTNDLNPDGLSGYTKDIADGNQILKSTITIYNAGQLSANQLGAITRHEFGHAMGLAHSTATEDLMHPTIQTGYPYISQCDVDALSGLYNGDKSSQVVCQN